MDFAERLESLAADVARLASESSAHKGVAQSLANELALLRTRTDAHEVRLEHLGDVVERIHALTREIRTSQQGFAADTVKHVDALHTAVMSHSKKTNEQSEVLASIATGVARALDRSDSQRQALESLRRWRALGATLLVLSSIIAGAIAGYFR